MSEVEENYTRLLGELKSSNPDATEEQLEDLFGSLTSVASL